jgi:hypothetical protein
LTHVTKALKAVIQGIVNQKAKLARTSLAREIGVGDCHCDMSIALLSLFVVAAFAAECCLPDKHEALAMGYDRPLNMSFFETISYGKSSLRFVLHSRNLGLLIRSSEPSVTRGPIL